jgi:hypothetical protein
LTFQVLRWRAGDLGPVWIRENASFFRQLLKLALKAGVFSHSNFLKARRASGRSFWASFQLLRHINALLNVVPTRLNLAYNITIAILARFMSY